MYQRIDADGYNNYQATGTTPYGNEAIYQPYDIKEPYYDAFHMFSLKVSYDMSFANLTSASSLLEARRLPGDGFDRGSAEHFQLHGICPQSLLGKRSDHAGGARTAPHVAGRRGLPVGGRPVLFGPALRLYHEKSDRRICDNPGVSAGGPLGGHCDPADQFLYAPPVTGPNPEGIMFQRQQPERPEAGSDLR